MTQVVAMRLPLEAVQPHLPAILEGVLLWAADSKNKFKLKVRLPCGLTMHTGYATIFNSVFGYFMSGNHRYRVRLPSPTSQSPETLTGCVATASPSRGLLVCSKLRGANDAYWAASIPVLWGFEERDKRREQTFQPSLVFQRYFNPQLREFNVFNLQVRVIVERLARRCGYDAVAAAIPEAHRKLLTHIRKERVRKDGRRHSEAGSEVRDCLAAKCSRPPRKHSVCRVFVIMIFVLFGNLA